MPKTLIVVDDFLGNPHEVRDAALGLGYPELDVETPYAGRNSAQRLHIEGLDNEVARLVGDPVAPTTDTSHGSCRIALADEEGANDVHVDHGDWSGILYLSLPEHCTGGTDFFRHRPTGAELVSDLAAHGFSTFDEVVEGVLEPDGSDPEKWEQTMQVPMRFNRLILFRPWLWHSGGRGFGNNHENGRLVYLMFFSLDPPARAPR